MTLPVLVLFLCSCGMVVFSGFAGYMISDFAALLKIAILSVVLILLSGFLFLIRCNVLPGKNDVKRSCTWDCGYIAPTARMEYTGSAFVQPITDFCRYLLKPWKKIQHPSGLFAREASYESETPDPGLERFWSKLFFWIAKISEQIHFLQSGYLHLYILIATAALIAMLIWGIMLPWSGTLMEGVSK